ncbi:TPA: helix-turn-helix transcriptional regulator [Yersinia enterocolitica]
MLPPKTSSLNERLKYIMSQLDLTQLGMARELNTMPQTVNNWLRRDSIRKETAQLICDKFGYSIDWLLHGIGDPKKENHHPDSTIPPESEWGTIEEWDSNTPLRDDEVEVPFLRDIELAAGDGSYNEEDYNGFKLRFSKSTLRRVGAQAENVLCFPARGNSMEPMIPDGAAVAVDCANKKIIDGKVYAINQDGWKRIKMLYRTGPNEVSIRSYNKEEHPDETANLKDIEIIGRMFWSSMIWD